MRMTRKVGAEILERYRICVGREYTESVGEQSCRRECSDQETIGFP